MSPINPSKLGFIKLDPNLMIIAKTIAKRRLDSGPTKATFNGPYFISLYKLNGLYGTGFAHPIIGAPLK